MKTVITERLGLGLCCKLRLWLESFSSSQIFQSGFVFLCLKPTSYVSQWQVSACNYLCTSHSMPHKKGYQVCIFKTNELLVNTFEAINQSYHFLSTDRDVVAFKFLPGARHRSGVQPLLVCPARQGCSWRAMGSQSPGMMVYVVSQLMTFWGRHLSSGTQQKRLHLFCHTWSPSQTSYHSMAALHTTKHLSCCLQGTWPGLLSALSVSGCCISLLGPVASGSS